MSKNVKLRKGFNINLKGAAEKKIASVELPDTFAVKPTDFINVTRPKLVVAEGDSVKAGDPLVYDKLMDKVMINAPVSGEVVEINRGPKRRLEEIKILADKTIEYREFKKYTISDISNISKEEAIDNMCQGGVWPLIIQRPFGIVANPEESPKAIHISTFDSSPLAPDLSFALKNDAENFQVGIDILSKLTEGKVHLNLNADAEVSPVFNKVKGVQLNKFSGPHPAGNVGVQIHHIDPINKGDLVWTVSPVGVAQIGRLFLSGKYDAKKVIAIAGSCVEKPQYVETISGACARKYLEGNLTEDNIRVVSGSVLSGESIGIDGYLGYYDNAFYALPEGNYSEFFGWIKPSFKKLSFHRALGLFSFMNGSKKEYEVDTNLKGEPRAFVQTGTFEQVVPMDIYPTYLLKAILANDFDEMEALGLYEIIEEDFALCEFVDVSKHEVQKIVRDGIELLRNS